MRFKKVSLVAAALAISASGCGEPADAGAEQSAVSPGPSTTTPPGGSSGPMGMVPPGSSSVAAPNGPTGDTGGNGAPTSVAPTPGGSVSGPGPTGMSGPGPSVPVPVGASGGASGGAGDVGGSGAGGASGGLGGSGIVGGAGGNPAMAGSGGQTPAGGGSSGTGGTDTGSGGAPPDGPGGEACPADATFCSGFESAELPEGAVFKLNGDPATPWTALFEVDTEVHFAGNSSLRVRKNAEPNASTMYKMLAVPSGGADFWVRFYLRSDSELGQEGHNAYAVASTSDDPNDAAKVEFADDVGLSFNASDNVRWPEGYGRLTDGSTNPYSLPANEWHCIELHFSGQTQSLYVAGEELIAASGYPSSAITFGSFKFGYVGYHNESDRGVWYDDVAVGPSRIGCE